MNPTQVPIASKTEDQDEEMTDVPAKEPDLAEVTASCHSTAAEPDLDDVPLGRVFKVKKPASAAKRAVPLVKRELRSHTAAAQRKRNSLAESGPAKKARGRSPAVPSPKATDSSPVREPNKSGSIFCSYHGDVVRTTDMPRGLGPVSHRFVCSVCDLESAPFRELAINKGWTLDLLGYEQASSRRWVAHYHCLRKSHAFRLDIATLSSRPWCPACFAEGETAKPPAPTWRAQDHQRVLFEQARDEFQRTSKSRDSTGYGIPVHTMAGGTGGVHQTARSTGSRKTFPAAFTE